LGRPRVAAIATEYRPTSHADVIISKLLEGYDLFGTWTDPRIEVASLYLDQVPANDIGRAMAARHNVPIFSSIGEAIALGGTGVAVDGIVLIGEHGRYPVNELGQILYPRRRFFEAAVAAMVGAGRVVPVFNDKHLSWSFNDARWMSETARRLGIPFLAGSTTPLAWHVPALALPLEVKVDEAVGIGYGPLEGYGYHALEMVQAMVERRAGGETGVRSVHCLEGDAAWEAGRDGRWNPALFDAAVTTLGKDGGALRADRPEATAAFLVEYADGLRAAVLMLDGIDQFAFAASADGRVEACQVYLQHSDPYGHFTFLVRQIEAMVLTGAPPYPVARTLLATGMIDAVMRSRHAGHVRLETPGLGIVYRAPAFVPDTGVGATPPAPVPSTI
jgi:hypothetical protein